MSEAWIVVFFVAIIVFGVVGGQLMELVLKELLPLLRSMAEERRRVPAQADLSALPQQLASIEKRLAQIEANQESLQEENEFLHRLLEDRADAPTLPRAGR